MTRTTLRPSETRELRAEVMALPMRLNVAVREMRSVGLISTEQLALVRHFSRLAYDVDGARTYRNAHMFAFGMIQIARAIGTLRGDPQDNLYNACNWLALALDDAARWRLRMGGHVTRSVASLRAAQWACHQTDDRINRLYASVDAKRAKIANLTTDGLKVPQTSTSGV